MGMYMEKYKAIPEGYMTVGEIAKKMGVTVRTLQYYDKEGLLPPSAESEGGRRLYTDKDVIRLYQLLSMKSLGFTLDDIKHGLFSLESPGEVAHALEEQAKQIQGKIDHLSRTLHELHLLKEEVLKLQTVDFKKYSDILVNLQLSNEYYWMVKHFDDETLDYLRNRFTREASITFIDSFNKLNNRILVLNDNHIPPNSPQAQALAKEFWDMIMEFTKGDMSMLPKLIEMSHVTNSSDECAKRQTSVTEYIEKALDVYLSGLGVNPFEEDTK